jgi:phosphoribosyl-AMP cyclohydrolase / phosphoribosyl-ATP pyrophosphohydrolase
VKPATPVDIETLWSQVKADERGLVPCITKDRLTGLVLMVAWVSKDALEASLTTGDATYFSRSRNRLWVKGETSGHTQRIVEVRLDCDGDTLLYSVDAILPACHEGEATCFSWRSSPEGWVRSPEQAPAVVSSAEGDEAGGGRILEALDGIIQARRAPPSDDAPPSYTRRLLEGGLPLQAEKIREESAELISALENETDERVASEAADLLYHVAVALNGRNLGFSPVFEVLARRFGRSGIEEKLARNQKPADPT